MNINQVQELLVKIITAGITTPVMLSGSPGLGKSSIVKQVCQDLGLELVDLRISQLAPTDIRGIPTVSDRLMSFAIPSFYPTSGRGILFLDEFNMAPSSVMGICQQLLLDRQVGDYRLPDGWFIVAAGNRKEDGCAVNPIPGAVANRLIHVEVNPDLDTWITNYAIPTSIDERVIAFLKFRENLFSKYDKNSLAYPTPRSWDVASRLVKIDVDISHVVGEGTASEFNSFIKVYEDLPNIDDILKGKSVKLTKNSPDVILATLVSLSLKMSNKSEVENAFVWARDTVDPEYVSIMFSMSLKKLQSISGAIVLIAKKLGNTIKELTDLIDLA